MLDKILLRIAKTAILHRFDSNYTIDKEKLTKEYPYLSNEGATFVTLDYDHQLRGCIGSIIAYRSLLDDLIGNAVSAAFKDPRFSPLHAEELSHLKLEVSVLTPPKLLEYDDFNDLCSKIRPHKDGLILQHGIYQGTFLPQVWEQLPTPQQFLEHLSYKSGASISIYNQHPTIYSYQVDAIEEEFDEVSPL